MVKAFPFSQRREVLLQMFRKAADREINVCRNLSGGFGFVKKLTATLKEFYRLRAPMCARAFLVSHMRFRADVAFYRMYRRLQIA
jgi:hypothetical protein